MRLSKIESDNIVQTPKTPVKNRSYVEIYNEDEGVSIRPIVRLEPDYPIVGNSPSDTLHERFPKIDLPIDDLDGRDLLYPSGMERNGNLSVRVAPGTRNETNHTYLDWEDFTASVKPEELREVFSNVLDNEIRVYEGDLYKEALQHNDSLERESFSEWISEKPSFIYERLVRNCRPGGLNEFEPTGAFYEQMSNIQYTPSLDGGRIMKGNRQIGTVEDQLESTEYGLKSVDGIIVPEDNETIESFLEDFRR